MERFSHTTRYSGKGDKWQKTVSVLSTHIFPPNNQIKSLLLILAFNNIPTVTHHHSDFRNIIFLGKISA